MANIIELHALRTVELAQNARSILEKFFAGLSDFPVYWMQSRIKSVDRIVQNVFSNRRNGMPGYGVDDVRDVCAFRFSPIFNRDIISLVKRLLDFVSDKKLPHTPLRRGRGIELKVYTSSVAGTPFALAEEVKIVAQNAELLDEFSIVTKGSGPSTVHLLVYCSLPQRGGTEVLVPVEIQFRNALDAIWSEIDHRLRYRGTRGTDIASYLSVLQAQFDACNTYTQLIGDVVERDPTVEGESTFRGSAENKIVTPSVSPPQPVWPPQRLERLHDLSPGLRRQLELAYDLWESADATRQFGGDASAYRRAAEAFGLVLDNAPKELRDLGLLKELTSIACMERAYLLSSTGYLSDLRLAQAIYERVLDAEPANSVAHFRLGQLFLNLNEIVRSVRHFRDAIHLNENRDKWFFNVARLGFARASWRLFTLQTLALHERERALKEAIAAARAVYDEPVEEVMRRTALNDLLYYAWEERAHSADDGTWQITSSEFAQLADLLAKENEEMPGRSVAIEDTLMRAYDNIGDREKAFLHANRVCDLLEVIAEHASEHRPKSTHSRLSSNWLISTLHGLKDESERDALISAARIAGSATTIG
jgi:ppGpp synthetase/RelA/SpoT-type nucleotidyltranferase/tetratricopeptide (TPR) repeat protein